MAGHIVDLDGFLAGVGGGYWVKIAAKRVPADAARPQGVAYALTLHEPGGRRVLGIDNAHITRLTAGRAGDHRRRATIFTAARPYVSIPIATRPR